MEQRVVISELWLCVHIAVSWYKYTRQYWQLCLYCRFVLYYIVEEKLTSYCFSNIIIIVLLRMHDHKINSWCVTFVVCYGPTVFIWPIIRNQPQISTSNKCILNCVHFTSKCIHYESRNEWQMITMATFGCPLGINLQSIHQIHKKTVISLITEMYCF